MVLDYGFLSKKFWNFTAVVSFNVEGIAFSTSFENTDRTRSFMVLTSVLALFS